MGLPSQLAPFSLPTSAPSIALISHLTWILTHTTSAVKVLQGLIQTQANTLSSPQLCLTGFTAVTLTKPLLLCNNPIDTYQCWTITAFCSVGWLKLSQCKVREENVTFEMRGGFCSTLSRNINNNDTRDSKSLQLYYKLSSLPLCLRISHPNKSWHF